MLRLILAPVLFTLYCTSTASYNVQNPFRHHDHENYVSIETKVPIPTYTSVVSRLSTITQPPVTHTRTQTETETNTLHFTYPPSTVTHVPTPSVSSYIVDDESSYRHYGAHQELLQRLVVDILIEDAPTSTPTSARPTSTQQSLFATPHPQSTNRTHSHLPFHPKNSSSSGGCKKIKRYMTIGGSLVVLAVMVCLM